jgi:hypothetical protein
MYINIYTQNVVTVEFLLNVLTEQLFGIDFFF